MKSNTIVLIHGLWLTPRSWELFQGLYEERGWRVIDASLDQLRHRDGRLWIEGETSLAVTPSGVTGRAAPCAKAWVSGSALFSV